MRLAHINDFMRYKRRGTLKNPATGRCHNTGRVSGERGRKTEDREKCVDERELSHHRLAGKKKD